MANVEDYKLSTRSRCNRYFSTAFKQEKVRDLERGLTSVAEICRTYHVSRTSVNKWRHRYSVKYQKEPKLIVEKQSDTKRIQALEQKIRDLERLLGEKEFALDFQGKMIELASQELGIDIKKNFGSKRSSGTGPTEQNTDTP